MSKIFSVNSLPTTLTSDSESSFKIYITNSSQNALEFYNPPATQGRDFPALDELLPALQNQNNAVLSDSSAKNGFCFMIALQYGTSSGSVCTVENSAQISLSLSYSSSGEWTVSESSSVSKGRYWIVYNEKKAELLPNDSIILEMSSLNLNHAPGMTPITMIMSAKAMSGWNAELLPEVKLTKQPKPHVENICCFTKTDRKRIIQFKLYDMQNSTSVFVDNQRDWENKLNHEMQLFDNCSSRNIILSDSNGFRCVTAFSIGYLDINEEQTRLNPGYLCLCWESIAQKCILNNQEVSGVNKNYPVKISQGGTSVFSLSNGNDKWELTVNLPLVKLFSVSKANSILQSVSSPFVPLEMFSQAEAQPLINAIYGDTPLPPPPPPPPKTKVLVKWNVEFADSVCINGTVHPISGECTIELNYYDKQSVVLEAKTAFGFIWREEKQL